eukprot:1697223-Rhodomonas_salina.2
MGGDLGHGRTVGLNDLVDLRTRACTLRLCRVTLIPSPESRPRSSPTTTTRSMCAGVWGREGEREKASVCRSARRGREKEGGEGEEGSREERKRGGRVRGRSR